MTGQFLVGTVQFGLCAGQLPANVAAVKLSKQLIFGHQVAGFDKCVFQWSGERRGNKTARDRFELTCTVDTIRYRHTQCRGHDAEQPEHNERLSAPATTAKRPPRASGVVPVLLGSTSEWPWRWVTRPPVDLTDLLVASRVVWI